MADVFYDGGRYFEYSFLHHRRLVTRFARNNYDATSRMLWF